MKTRSQSKQELTVNIDFDDASLHWKANKKSIGNGQYTYICMMCKRVALPGCDVCKVHCNVTQIELLHKHP